MTGWFVLGVACGVTMGCCATFLLITGIDWQAIRDRRHSRRCERAIRKRTLNARRELERKIPRAEAKRRQAIKRDLIASVLSKGGR